MKKAILLILFLLVSCGTNLFATHREILDVSNAVAGTLSPDRVSKSTFTLRGQLTDGTQHLNVSTVTALQFIGDGQLITGITSASISSGTYISSGAGTVNNYHILDRTVSDNDLAYTLNITSLTVYSGITSTSGIKVGLSTVTAKGGVFDFIPFNGVTYQWPNTDGASGQVLKTDGLRTLTWSNDNNSGGGGGVSSASGTVRQFDVYVGTLGVQGVDVASGTVDGLNQALNLIGAQGTTNNNTTKATIFYKSGTYDMSNATIPYNVRVVGNGDVVWKLNDTNKSLANIYGKVNGIIFNCGDTTFNSTILTLHSNSELKNFEIVNAKNKNSTASNNVFKVNAATNVLITDGYITDYRNGANAQAGFYSDGYPFFIFKADGLTIRNVTMSTYTQTRTDGQEGVWSIFGSSNVVIDNLMAENVGFRFIGFMGGRNNTLRNSRINIKTATQGDAAGVIYITGRYSSMVNSTSTIIQDNLFILSEAGNADKVISITDNGNGTAVIGTVVENNKFVATVENSWTAIALQQPEAIKSILTGNKISNFSVGISDSGTGTKYTGLGNFVDGIEQ